MGLLPAHRVLLGQTEDKFKNWPGRQAT